MKVTCMMAVCEAVRDCPLMPVLCSIHPSASAGVCQPTVKLSLLTGLAFTTRHVLYDNQATLHSLHPRHLPLFHPLHLPLQHRRVPVDRKAARDAQVLAGAAEAVDPRGWLHGAAARDAPVLQASCHGVENCRKVWGRSARV